MPQFIDIRFWSQAVIVLIVVALLLTARGMKGRGSLLGFVALSFAAYAGFYIPVLLFRHGLIDDALHRTIMMQGSVPLGVVGGLAWLLLLVYVVTARAAGGDLVTQEQRARYAQALDPSAEHDLIDLAEHGAVSVAGTGQDITQVRARTMNLSGKPLRIVITPGTCFTSSGAHQNMVAVETTRFSLQPAAEQELALRAACVNADRPIPTDADSFRGVHRVPATLTRFLQASVDASQMVRQAGVWAITDGYTGDDIRRHLVARDRDGNQRPAISDGDIAEARRLLDSIGAQHRL